MHRLLSEIARSLKYYQWAHPNALKLIKIQFSTCIINTVKPHGKSVAWLYEHAAKTKVTLNDIPKFHHWAAHLCCWFMTVTGSHLTPHPRPTHSGLPFPPKFSIPTFVSTPLPHGFYAENLSLSVKWKCEGTSESL